MRWLLLVLLLSFPGCGDGFPDLLYQGREDQWEQATAVTEGYWTEPSERAWINAWDDSTIDLVATVPFNTRWPRTPQWSQFSQHYVAVATFSLHLNADSTVSCMLRGVWTRDSLQVINVPLPDSLASVVWQASGLFSLADSLYVGQACCDTNGFWYDAYEVGPGWRIEVSASGSYIYPEAVRYQLKRQGIHHGGTP
jgi:hypothetical protein